MRDINQAEAEIGVIAAILERPDAMHEAQATITADDFAKDGEGRSTNGEAFAMLSKIDDAGLSLQDAAMVVDQFRSAGLIDRIGGIEVFRETYLRPNANLNVEHYAQAVRSYSARRRLLQLQRRVAGDAGRDIADPVEYVCRLRLELDAIEQAATTDSHIIPIGTACKRLRGEIAETKRTGGTVGLDTGIQWFDERYGLHPRKLYVLAARPGNGKTSLGQQFAETIAGENVGTLLVSLEMGHDEIAARYLSRASDINSKAIGNHCTTDIEDDRIGRAADAAERLPFFVSCPRAPRRMTSESIIAESRLMAATKGISMVVIDYLQIIEPSSGQKSEYDKVTAATRQFKQLSRELNIPVLLLSQLSRKGDEGGKVREPILSDLRSSGSIEQDADGVLLLHNADPTASGSTRQVELIIAKMRGGELDRTTLTFDGPTTSFSDSHHCAVPELHDNFTEARAEGEPDGWPMLG